MHRKINKVAVLGSGIMGSRIACHFANTGVDVLLLDIVPTKQTTEEIEKKVPIDSLHFRNRIVNQSLQNAIKSNPSPLYRKSFSERIKTGNFSDNLKEINSCDWIMEVVIENLEIKKQLFTEVEKHRKPGTLVTSNTSGIPIQMMCEGRSDDFQQHFCGTHFFNPPRYLPLLEIIPTNKTTHSVVDFLLMYGDKFLGKTTVLCKDTPAFIANRIGVFSIMNLFHQVEKMNLSVEDIDKLTGPVLGRPKSATFRTTDVVGLDTLVHVANGLQKTLTEKKEIETFTLPAFIQKMVENKWFGDKTKQGFYKKSKNKEGKAEILSLDLKSFEYKPQSKTKFPVLEQTKQIDNVKDRLVILVNASDQAGAFYRASFFALFEYVSNHIPEISNDIWAIDEAMKAGFGWELGPFEMWDAIGVEAVCKQMKSAGYKYAGWIDEMLESKQTTFYKTESGSVQCYSYETSTNHPIPGQEQYIVLNNIRPRKTIWKNTGTTICEIGDGIINLEFHTKMNTIGSEVMEGLNMAIDLAEKEFQGLVIANNGANFSAGANLALIYMLALEQEWDEIDMAVRVFQKANMRIRYSSIPVVVAPHGLALGGGCEMTLHADKVQASAETYIGMVEFGVGLIPGGGGSKEFAVRLSDSFKEGDIEINLLRERFLTIAMAKVSTSAHEAFDLGILRKGTDAITINKKRLISEAKKSCLELAEKGYQQPAKRKDIKVLGKTGLGIITAGANAMFAGHYMSEHDKLISEKLGYVMCGGKLSTPTLVSEQYILDLEREAFLSLCGTKKTLQRIQSILTTGKPLRN